ncbi:MAG: hypothetical protein J2P23_10425 [Microlunatus sp.]|nr:hypothetical protein [Microlunatus sp.]
MRILHTVVNAPWLPPGGRAEIVSADHPPSPTGLVRLLVRAGELIFCEPRRDTGKIDIPTAPVAADDLEGRAAAAALAERVLGGSAGARLLGYVRNVVPDAVDDYPWPTPLAHFSVWVADGKPVVAGTWVDTRLDGCPLHDRHWWPLLRTITG